MTFRCTLLAVIIVLSCTLYWSECTKLVSIPEVQPEDNGYPVSLFQMTPVMNDDGRPVHIPEEMSEDGNPSRETEDSITKRECEDKSNGCAAYKNRGYCKEGQRFRGWMGQNCRLSCGFCANNKNCVDKHNNCPRYRRYCDDSTYRNWMELNCQKSCNLCFIQTTPPPTRRTTASQTTKPQKNCKDKYSSCPQYKTYCSTSQAVRNFCRATCDPKCKSTTESWPINRAEVVKVDQDKCVKEHNDKRRRHGVQPLEWNTDLVDQARAWALELAKTGKFDHDPKNRQRGTGENLYYSAVYGRPSEATCSDAVEGWYSEIKNYPFNNPPFTLPPQGSPMIGHFTQVVWKNTKAVGVGIARIATKSGSRIKYATYIVAKYTPPGNYQGRFSENVNPPR